MKLSLIIEGREGAGHYFDLEYSWDEWETTHKKRFQGYKNLSNFIESLLKP